MAVGFEGEPGFPLPAAQAERARNRDEVIDSIMSPMGDSYHGDTYLEAMPVT